MTMAAVTRLLILCTRPLQLPPSDADEWLRSELRALLADALVARLDVIALTSASLAWARQWDYLIEIDLREGSDPDAVVRAPACAALLGDLRLLGMRPTVVVADDAHAIAIAGGEG